MAGRRLVEALAAAASRNSSEDQKQKGALLEALEGCVIRHPGTLLRLHETLCFLQAYPDDAQILVLVDGALETFPARVERLGRRAQRRLHDSGGANTPRDYPFPFPRARGLARHVPRDTELARAGLAGADQPHGHRPLLRTA